MKKIYFCEVDVGEEVPYYSFFIETDNEEKAEIMVKAIAGLDYPDYIKIANIKEIKNIEDLRKIAIKGEITKLQGFRKYVDSRYIELFKWIDKE